MSAPDSQIEVFVASLAVSLSQPSCTPLVILEHCPDKDAEVESVELEFEDTDFEEHEKRSRRSESSNSLTMSDTNNQDDENSEESSTSKPPRPKKPKTSPAKTAVPSPTKPLPRTDIQTFGALIPVGSSFASLSQSNLKAPPQAPQSPIGSTFLSNSKSNLKNPPPQARLLPIGSNVAYGSKSSKSKGRKLVYIDVPWTIECLKEGKGILHKKEIDDSFSITDFPYKAPDAYPKLTNNSRCMEDYFIATKLWMKILNARYFLSITRRKFIPHSLSKYIDQWKMLVTQPTISESHPNPTQYISTVNREDADYLPTSQKMVDHIFCVSPILQILCFAYPHLCKHLIPEQKKVYSILKQIKVNHVLWILQYAKTRDLGLLSFHTIEDLLATHESLMKEEPRKKKGYFSHWFFAFRAVLIHKMIMDVFHFDDTHLMAGCACVLGHTVAEKKKRDRDEKDARNREVMQREERKRESTTETQESMGHPSENQDTTLHGSERVLRHVMAASLELVSQDTVLTELLHGSLSTICDDLRERERERDLMHEE